MTLPNLGRFEPLFVIKIVCCGKNSHDQFDLFKVCGKSSHYIFVLENNLKSEGNYRSPTRLSGRLNHKFDTNWLIQNFVEEGLLGKLGLE